MVRQMTLRDSYLSRTRRTEPVSISILQNKTPNYPPEYGWYNTPIAHYCMFISPFPLYVGIGKEIWRTGFVNRLNHPASMYCRAVQVAHGSLEPIPGPFDDHGDLH